MYTQQKSKTNHLLALQFIVTPFVLFLQQHEKPTYQPDQLEDESIVVANPEEAVIVLRFYVTSLNHILIAQKDVYKPT